MVMGILNVTPDSFSDGGHFADTERAVQHGLELVRHGADILDIGGESTRPGARDVPLQEELQRVLPVIERLVPLIDVPISVDTRKSEVAAAAVELGAEIINDVSGFRDRAMRTVAARTGAGLCVMHMRGTPQDMQDDPKYDDVVTEVRHYLVEQMELLLEDGVDAARICLDPGIGFGKRTAHNWELLQQIDRFLELGRPVLIGHSRKGFLGKLIGDPQADRTYATVGVSLAMAARGVHILRVHDVLATRQALDAHARCQPR